jgi:hypothetical protein
VTFCIHLALSKDHISIRQEARDQVLYNRITLAKEEKKFYHNFWSDFVKSWFNVI